jgi:hypothetical protein
MQGYWIRREVFDVSKDFVQMTDFTVRVRNLPPIDSYDALDQLAAALTLHIRKIVAAEDEVSVGKADEVIAP